MPWRCWARGSAGSRSGRCPTTRTTRQSGRRKRRWQEGVGGGGRARCRLGNQAGWITATGDRTMLTRRKMLAASAAGLAAPAVIGGATAATPKNTVVMAKAIDDIVGAMDPAESYENSNNEICGNVYRRLVTPDPADTNKIIGELAEKWEVSEDGLTFN